MNIKPLVGLIVVGLFTLSVEAALIGSDQGSPGYSAKDILFQGNFSGDGVYWVDPDLVGGNDAVQVFADMSTDGGGWMLANDADNGLPALNSNAWTIGF